MSNVYCWGQNGEGELGRPTSGPTSIGGSPTAPPLTGAVDGGPLGIIPDAVQLEGGQWHFCAITQTRAILCWGGTYFYQCGGVLGTGAMYPTVIPF